jgi:hypothetical protein
MPGKNRAIAGRARNTRRNDRGFIRPPPSDANKKYVAADERGQAVEPV